MRTSSDHDGELRQGDTRLLGTALARDLLAAATPAYLAYTALDGSPRNIPMKRPGSGHRARPGPGRGDGAAAPGERGRADLHGDRQILAVDGGVMLTK